MIYTERRSTQSSGGRNRFHFQIKQQANKTEKNKLQHSLLGPAYSCCSFVTSQMRPEAFLLFLITTHTFPQTLQPPHCHTDTHGHSGPGCSLCQHSATCTCHLLTKGKGEAARHPWPPQTHLSVGVSPWLTFREGAQLGSRIIGSCTAEIWPCFRNRHRLPNEFPTACSPRLPFLSVSHSSPPHVLFSCNSMCFILHHHKEDV